LTELVGTVLHVPDSSPEVDGGGRRHRLRRRWVRGSGDLHENGSNRLGEWVGKLLDVALVRVVGLVGGEGDQNELEEEEVWRRCSGQFGGRRASLLDFSLLSEAEGKVKLDGGEWRGRGLLK
jgi:hypothetical protein